MSDITITTEMWEALNKRVTELESRTVGLIRVGPMAHDPMEQVRAIEKIAERLAKDKILPVDRSNRQLASGDPVPADGSHRELRANGQQKDYVVLSPSEREKGFVRPYRDAYRHLKCGKITTMGREIAETYATDPGFYTGTMCIHCGGHFPVGENGEFTWYEMDGTEGPKVGV